MGEINRQKWQVLIFTLLGFCSVLAQSPGGGPPMPSLQDEKDTYTRWGWTWTTATDQDGHIATSGNCMDPYYVNKPVYSVSDPDIHYDTEGDDLWNYIMMYRRSANNIYLVRANAWLRYFKEDYRQCVPAASPNGSTNLCFDKGYELCHLYGWGLVAQYEYNGDAAALAAAESLAVLAENYYSAKIPGSVNMAIYGMRAGARHLLLATRVAEATGKQRWITLRDKILNLWRLSPDWDSARGMYFVGNYSTDYSGTQWPSGVGAYASGTRAVSTFQISMLAEAFYQAYRTTGLAWLKDRMVAMARFTAAYSMDDSTDFAGLSIWVLKDGTKYVWGKQPTYTTSLVNALVLGYKYSGDISLFNLAKHAFARGTKFDSDGARFCSYWGYHCDPNPGGDLDGVHHFVDARFESSSGSFYLAFNKGELQYTYHIFENGGAPAVEVSAEKSGFDGALPEIQVSPNPFNTTTRITFKHSGSCADVAIYDISGHLVRNINNTTNSFLFKANGLPNGVYLVKAKSGKKQMIQRVLLQK